MKISGFLIEPYAIGFVDNYNLYAIRPAWHRLWNKWILLGTFSSELAARQAMKTYINAAKKPDRIFYDTRGNEILEDW